MENLFEIFSVITLAELEIINEALENAGYSAIRGVPIEVPLPPAESEVSNPVVLVGNTNQELAGNETFDDEPMDWTTTYDEYVEVQPRNVVEAELVNPRDLETVATVGETELLNLLPSADLNLHLTDDYLKDFL